MYKLAHVFHAYYAKISIFAVLECWLITAVIWSLLLPGLKCIPLSVPELWALNFPLAPAKSANFGVLGQKGVKLEFFAFGPQKALPWQKLRVMTCLRRGCVQKGDLWTWR